VKKKMKISYDPEADALYIELHPAKVAQTKEIIGGVYLDIDGQGEPRGIEILYASTRAPEIAKGHLDIQLL
jgi:uncharacterized protein YuzE